MPSLAYTPYATAYRPFSIGLAPLDPARWIEPDERLAAELAEKERLLAEAYSVVFRAEPDTGAAQAEVLALLADYLLAHHPSIYRRRGTVVDILPAGCSVETTAASSPALERAARLVQDDLVLMRRGADGWRLAAAALAFPSSWSLAEKFGQPLDRIHAAVPGFPGRMGERVARIFDNLKAEQPVWRVNWSIYDDADLHHPQSKAGPRRWSGAAGRFGESAFVRVERQTLRRLPASGDILFTIRVYVDPVAAFARHPQGAELARGLREQLLGLDEAQLRYKNLVAERDRIAAELLRLIEEHGR